MSDRESALISQVELETERYLRHNGIDVERYGMGGNVMKLLMSVLAMHAANHIMSGGSHQSQPKPKPAQQSTPNNQPFEKLHPRETAPVAGHKPGQFAKKPGSDQPAAQREVRPLKDPMQGRVTQQPPSAPTPQQTQPQPQKPPVQQPKDANTARIAEIWDVDTTVPGHDQNVIQNKPAPPTLESFTADVMGKLKTQPAGPNPRKRFLQDGSANPDFNPQYLGVKKIAKPSLLDMPAQSGDGDIFENPAAKARREKAELDRITKFDVNEFAEPEGEEEFAGGEEFDIPAPTEEEFDTPEQLQKMQDYRARRPASEDPQELAAWRKTKPETFESATQKWNAKRYRLNSKNKKAVQDDPEENIYQVAEQNEFLPEKFKAHIDEMQRFEQGEWERREKVKSNILKAWNTDRSTLKRMENRNQDHSNLLGADQLKGSVADSDLHEFLGSDDGEWAQNAWAMVREDTPPRPGAHDKDWLNGHAENFKRMQAMIEPDAELYPEPEDGMPFSRKSLTREIDRYFKQEELRFHGKKPQSSFSFWTVLDSWL